MIELLLAIAIVGMCVAVGMAETRAAREHEQLVDLIERMRDIK